jgi:hypothetical protein
MSDQIFDDDVPSAILRAFAERTYLDSPEMAALFAMDPRTLCKHVRAGNVTWRQKGLGTKSPRRRFSLADAINFHHFLERRGDQPCGGNIVNLNSFGTRGRRTGISTSGLSAPVPRFDR